MVASAGRAHTVVGVVGSNMARLHPAIPPHSPFQYGAPLVRSPNCAIGISLQSYLSPARSRIDAGATPPCDSTLLTHNTNMLLGASPNSATATVTEVAKAEEAREAGLDGDGLRSSACGKQSVQVQPW